LSKILGNMNMTQWGQWKKNSIKLLIVHYQIFIMMI